MHKFSIKQKTKKENLVFMNNLYRKVAVTSVGIALGFALGVNKEAKAATFTLTGTEFAVEDTTGPNGSGSDGLGDVAFYGGYHSLVQRERYSAENLTRETRAFYEFNVGNLSAANTVISHAIFEAKILNLSRIYRYLFVEIYGYVGNGTPDVSDFQAGVFLGWDNIYFPPMSEPYNYLLKFDVTNFVQQRVSNRDAFAGLGIRISNANWWDYGSFNLGGVHNFYNPSLTITTIDVAEPVPEPTTIFGSAIGLCLGGWLKRKKSSQQNKTTT